jgi:tetratricopeptide (TPR) repeat protein
MVAALRDYWWYTGFLSENRRWSELVLERMPGAPKALQAGVIESASQLDFLRYGPRKGENLLLQAIDLYLQLGDERRAAWSRMFLSVSYFDQVEKHQKGFSLCLGCLETFCQIGDLPGQAQALNILGEYTRLWGELDDSKRYYEQCLEIVAQTGEKLREGMLYANLGFIAYRQGNYINALNLMRDYLHIVDELGNDYGLMTAIASMSGSLAALGQPERAARLLAAAEMQMETIGGAHQETDLSEIEGYRRSIRSQLGDEAFQAAWEEGSHMTIQQMLALALEDAP